jgi:pyridoxine 4-dehydrogenase
MAKEKSNVVSAGTMEVGGDLTVNRLGFGAMRITGKGIIGDPPDKEEAKRVLRRGVELGVNFIDTADSYGPETSENLIAQALSPYPADLVIATKGGLVRPGPNQWTPDGRPEHLREACEGSLRRLGVEQIALYQFHRPDPTVPIEESVGEIRKMQEEGKIRHVGVSNVNDTELSRAQRVTDIVSVQNRYNVDDRRSEPILERCAKEGLVFIPYAPILDFDTHPVVRQIASKRGATPRQVVLAWLLAHSSAMLPIPGTGSVGHLEENLGAVDLTLDAEDMEALSSSSS